MESISMSPMPKANKVDVKNLISFPEAIGQVIKGKKITRVEWKDAGYYGFLNGETLSLHKPDGVNYQWVINDGDLMADDWYTI